MSISSIHGSSADPKAERLGAMRPMASYMLWNIKTGPAMSKQAMIPTTDSGATHPELSPGHLANLVRVWCS